MGDVRANIWMCVTKSINRQRFFFFRNVQQKIFFGPHPPRNEYSRIAGAKIHKEI